MKWHRDTHNSYWKLYEATLEDLKLEVRQLRGADQWAWNVWRGMQRLDNDTTANLAVSKSLAIDHAIHILAAQHQENASDK